MIESAPLFVWMTVLATYVRSNRPDLSNLQSALLLTIYMTPGPHYATDLASQLQASKSSIYKALIKLTSLDLVQQGADPNQRSNRILPTEKGAEFLIELKHAVERVLKSGVAKTQLRGLMRDLDLLGDDLRTAFPLPASDPFNDLLAAIP